MVKIILAVALLFPLCLNAYTTKQWVSFYLRDCAGLKNGQACRGKLESSIGRMTKYRKMVLKHLDREELPRWLAVVPIVESDYNERAVSKAMAAGMWQIMPYNIEAYAKKSIIFLNSSIEYKPTAKKIRKIAFDPNKNTEMAATHFGKLFMLYRDHEDCEKLSLMAYNAGTRRVNLWLLGKSRLPTETINYYNKIMAVKYIIRNMKALGVKPVRQLSLIDRIRGLL